MIRVQHAGILTICLGMVVSYVLGLASIHQIIITLKLNPMVSVTSTTGEKRLMNNDETIVYLPWWVIKDVAESTREPILDVWTGELINACRKTVDTQGWCICADADNGFSVCGAVCPVHSDNAVKRMRRSVARLTEQNDVLKRVIREDPKDYEKQSTHLVLLQDKIEKLRRRLKHKEKACHALKKERDVLEKQRTTLIGLVNQFHAYGAKEHDELRKRLGMP